MRFALVVFRHFCKHAIRYFGIATLALVAFVVNAQEPKKENKKNPSFENAIIKMRLFTRTAEQMSAFYEGRGFPKAAIEEIKKACFITVVIKNKSDEVVWLELKNWQIESAEQEIKRLPRSFWKNTWHSIDLPQASRSTFGWTLMPEQRDLRKDESVGGNITLTPGNKPFTLRAKFYTHADKKGEVIDARIDNIQCAGEG